METVGTSVPRLAAIEKVTGRATYVGNIKRSGMLHAKILPSPIPRARIKPDQHMVYVYAEINGSRKCWGMLENRGAPCTTRCATPYFSI